MSNAQLRIAFLLLLLLPMAVLALWVHERLKAELAGTFATVCPADEAVAWSKHDGDDWESTNALSLRDGSIRKAPVRSLATAGWTADDGRRVRYAPEGYEVWRPNDPSVVSNTFKLPVDFNIEGLLGNFLVGTFNGQRHATDSEVIAIDLDQAIGGAKAMSLAIPGMKLLYWWEKLRLIPGTNRFVCECPGLMPPTIKLIEIEPTGLKELASWNAGGKQAVAILVDQQIYTLSVDSKSLEIRSAVDGQLTATQPIPSSIAASWDSGIHHGGLLTYFDTTATKLRTVSITDLQPVSELEGLRPEADSNLRSVDRLQVFVDDLRTRHRAVVYDTLERRVVFDHRFDEAFYAAQVVGDHRMVVLSTQWGLTCTVANLATGKIENSFRPFFWPLTGLIVLIVCWLLWIKCWLAVEHSLPIWAQFAVLTLVIFLPVVWRLHDFRPRNSPAVIVIFMAALFSLVYWPVVHVVHGQGKLIWRAVTGLSALTSISGLLAMLSHFHPRDQTLLAVAWGVVFGMAIYCLILLTFCRQRFWLWLRGKTAGARTSPIYLRDVFAITAVVAALMATTLPMREQLALTFKANLSLILTQSVLIGTLQIVVATCVTCGRPALLRLARTTTVVAAVYVVVFTFMTCVLYDRLTVIAMVAALIALMFLVMVAYAEAVRRVNNL